MPRAALSPSYEFDQLPTYQYLPLPDDGRPWIRLLMLEPAKTREAPLECYLIQFVRGEVLYEALSYVWGDQSDKLPLVISGTAVYADGDLNSRISSRTTVKITRNLHTALLFLRDKKDARGLWVDAVCINQGDDDEKQRQIRLMGNIYSGATLTLIWVGEADKDTRKLFYWIRLVHRIHFLTKGIIPSKLDYRLKTRLARVGVAHLSMADFYDRPWFHRIWTAQELCLGLNVLVVCGDRSIEWYPLTLMDLFFQWTDRLEKDHDSSTAIRTPSHRGRRGISTRFNFFADFIKADKGDEAMKHVGQLGILNSVGYTQATEPADFVFGTLALGERLGVRFPPLKYDMGIERIYATATRCWLQHHGHLSCLTFAANGHLSRAIPSWAIDWRCRAPTTGDWRMSIFEAYASNGNNCRSWITATRDSSLQEVVCEKAHGLLLAQATAEGSSLEADHALSVSNVSGKTAIPPANLERKTSAKPENRNHHGIRLGDEVVLRWLRVVEQAESNLQFADMRMYHDLIRFALATSNIGQRMKDPIALGVSLRQIDVVFRDYVQDGKPSPPHGDVWARELWVSGPAHVEDVVLFGAALLVCIEANDLTLFITSEGQLGGCYCEHMEDGDIISLLSGSDFPMVLRKTEVEGEYRFVGPAYIETLMDGHAWPRNAEELQDITLV